MHIHTHAWWCCGDANIAYCTASDCPDCPVLSDILTLFPLPLPRTMPSVPATKRTNPSPTSNGRPHPTDVHIQHPPPNFDSDSDSRRSETGLTSTRTIDARHRRRHAYLTPPTNPSQIGQSKTGVKTNQHQRSAGSPPLPSLPTADLSAIPQCSALPGQGTVQAPSLHACTTQLRFPSPSRPSRGAGADHHLLIPCGRPSRGSHPKKCATFRSGSRRAAVHERASCKGLVQCRAQCKLAPLATALRWSTNADLLRVIPLGPAVRCGASRG